MADIKILLQAMARPWYMDPLAAKKYSAMVDLIFSRDASDAWQTELAKPVSKNDILFAADAAGNNMGSIDGSNPVPGVVAVIRIAGAVMKYDYCGAPGTQTIMDIIDELNANTNVNSIVLHIDSPGGAVDGTQQLANKIAGSAKPIVAYINGMMASAAVWFGAAAKYRIASSSTDMIGSIGTMVRWTDYSKQDEQMGIKEVEVYATASVNKNIETREAMAEKPNYQPLIDNILDPTNDEFISAVKTFLPAANEDVYTGSIYLAKQAQQMGLIDKIGTLSDAIKMAQQLAAKQQKPMSNQTQNFTKVLAATGMESLEQLNEGIWLTEAQLLGIEQALANADTTLATVNGGLTETQTALEDARTQMETMQADLTAAQARIAELEGMPIIGADTVTAGDVTGAEGDDPWAKYKTSADQQADKLRKMATS